VASAIRPEVCALICGRVSAKLFAAECIDEAQNNASVTSICQFVFDPSKEVSAALPVGASKNPSSASWCEDTSLPMVWNEIISHENQTTPNQFEALTAHDLSALSTTSRSDARVQHVVI
jgi:hypothetical protein